MISFITTASLIAIVLALMLLQTDLLFRLKIFFCDNKDSHTVFDRISPFFFEKQKRPVQNELNY